MNACAINEGYGKLLEGRMYFAGHHSIIHFYGQIISVLEKSGRDEVSFKVAGPSSHATRKVQQFITHLWSDANSYFNKIR